MDRALRLLSAATAAGMFLVLVMGAAVTNTGSAEGCGRSWPLCNGQFVPAFTVATAIEYSHRAVTGIESVLVVVLAVVMLMLWRADREVQILAPLMVVTLVLQAGLGGAAVMVPQSPAVLASHFGVSLVAFAATFLSAAYVFAQTRSHTGSGRRTGRGREEQPVPAAFRRAVLGTGVYILLVVYLGAYVRHAGVSLACVDWPLCNGQVVPSLEGATGVVFAHRLAALGAMLLLGWLMRSARSVGVGFGPAAHAFGLSLLQSFSGALVVWFRLDLFSTLAHAGVMALLFASVCVLVRRALLPRGSPLGAARRTKPRLEPTSA
ncbi:MAG: heme A synthase [Chloroflexi bacterium]|nr:heme A synthase [Chloroflexota bacterium]